VKTHRNDSTALLLGYLSLGLGVCLLVRFIGGPLLERREMEDWEPVHADVLAADLEARHGDRGTSYRVTGKYRYLFHGKTYTGSRLGHTQAADNIGNWHQEMHARLADGRNRGSGIRVWVNPAHPGESIVDRDPRTGYLLFLGAFISVPLLLGAGLIWWQKRSRDTAPPGSPPWLANRNWKDNRIRSNVTSQLWFYWGFALFWNLLNIPLLLQATEILAAKSPVAILVLVFPLVGTGLLLAALVKTRQWLRFGVATLSLQPFPGHPGGPVSGRIDIRLPWSAATRAFVTMSCMHACTERHGSERHTRRIVKWQDQIVVTPAPAQRGSRVNFRFTPPAGLPASGPAGNGRYYWTLDVNIPVPGADFVRQYEIPVLAAAGQTAVATGSMADARMPSPDNAAATTAAAGAFADAPRGSEELLGRVLKIGYSASGPQFSYLPRRSLKLSLVLLATGMLFSVTGSFLMIESVAPLLFILIFVLSGLAMFLYGIVSLGQRRDVTISSDRVRITNSYFGLERTTEVAVADITGISKRIGHQSGDGSHYRAAYSIYLNTRSGKTVRVGDSLPGSGMADYVIGEMRKIMRMPATGMREIPFAAADIRKAALQGKRSIRWLVNGIIAVVFLLATWHFLVNLLGRWT